MTHRLSEQLIAFDLTFVAVTVEVARLHMHRAVDDTELFGTAQAAFQHLLLALSLNDNGIDELDGAVADVDHAHTAHDTDLRCGKTDAAGIFECLH